MRLRVGLALGFAAGYYTGAKAGRERYEQMRQMVDRFRRSAAVDTITDKARAVVDLGVERARDVVGSKMGNGHETVPLATAD